MQIAHRSAAPQAFSHRRAVTQCTWPVTGARRVPVALPRPCRAARDAHEQEVSASTSVAPSIAPVAATEQQRSWFSSVLSQFARAAMLAGIVLVATFSSAGNALASKSGGRAGGSSFSSARSFSRSSSSSGYSGGSSFYSAPRSTPSVTHTVVHHHTPSLGFGWGMPSVFMPVTPVGGYGYGHSHGSSGGSVLMTVLLFGVVCFIAVQAFNMFKASQRSSGAYDDEDEEDMPITVAKVQVGLLALGDTIKSDLNLMAASADTSSPAGLHLLLQETVVALLRNPSYCAYGSSSAKLLSDPDTAERNFNAMSMEERSKVEQETLVNVSGAKRNKSVTINANSPAELVVVNLMVAVAGDLQLPQVRSLADLKLAMSKLGSVAANDVMAVEVFWTPQAEGDVLTQQECLMKYPHLVPL